MDVRALQTRLRALGFDLGPVDGRMGSRTIAAIKTFQQAQGLKPNGVVDPLTLRALDLRPNSLLVAPETVSSTCVDLVKAWEGLEDGDPRTVLLDPYVCPAGYVTVGWGHVLLDPAGRMIGVRSHGGREAALAAGRASLQQLFGRPAIDRDQAKALLAMDLNTFVAGVARQLRRPASQAEADAMVSFAFNVGLDGFGRSSVLKKHNAGEKVAPGPLDVTARAEASRRGRVTDMASAFLAWSKGPGWLLGLFRRRACEALVYRGDALEPTIAWARGIRA